MSYNIYYFIHAIAILSYIGLFLTNARFNVFVIRIYVLLIRVFFTYTLQVYLQRDLLYSNVRDVSYFIFYLEVLI